MLVPQGWLARLVTEFERRPDVKLLAPLNYHQTLSHPFGPENSAAAWFRTRKEYERALPLRQFHAYSGGLSIDEFDELMCSAHAGELAAHMCPPDFIGTCCALLDADFVAAVAASPTPGSQATAARTSIRAWRIGERGQVARTAAVYVHHFHNSSLIDNEVDGEAELRTANQILYAKWGAEAHRAGASGDTAQAVRCGNTSAHISSSSRCRATRRSSRISARPRAAAISPTR